MMTWRKAKLLLVLLAGICLVGLLAEGRVPTGTTSLGEMPSRILGQLQSQPRDCPLHALVGSSERTARNAWRKVTATCRGLDTIEKSRMGERDSLGMRMAERFRWGHNRSID